MSQFSVVSATVLVFLLVLVLQADLVVGGENKVCQIGQTAHPEGMCGSRLSDTVTLVCQLFESRLRRRSKRDLAALTGYDAGNLRDSSFSSSLSDVGMKRSDALSFLTKRGGSGTGFSDIICECCYNTCTTFELIQYCNIS